MNINKTIYIIIPLITWITVEIIFGDKKYPSIKTITNIIILISKYFKFFLKIYFILKSFLILYICTNVTTHSAHTVANAAPYDKKLGMNNIFKKKFTIDPKITDFV